ECRWSGIATHCLPARQIEEVLERLARPGMEPDRAVEEIGETELPPARLAGNAERIDRLFAADRFEPLLAALEADPSEWAAKELKAVRARCPTSAKVAL